MTPSSNVTRYCLGFALLKDSTWVVLIRKVRPDWQSGLLNGLGGHLEEGETPVQAMRREFREEAGPDIPEEEWDLYAVLRGPGFEVSVFRTHLETQEGIQTMTDEEVEIVPLSQIFNTYGQHAVVANIPWLIRMGWDPAANEGPFEINYPALNPRYPSSPVL